MSHDSRLAYHGVPRVLPPPPDASVPECLSLEALQHCAQRTQCFDERSSCSVCGGEWQVDPQCRGATGSSCSVCVGEWQVDPQCRGATGSSCSVCGGEWQVDPQCRGATGSSCSVCGGEWQVDPQCRGATGSNCSVCGGEWQVDPQCRGATGSSCSVCGGEWQVDPQCRGTTAGHPIKTKTPEEHHAPLTDAAAATGERTLQHCAADTRTEPEGGGVDSNPPNCPCKCSSSSVRCRSCQELAHSWPKFVAYLSVSRINVNIRQVVSEKIVF